MKRWIKRTLIMVMLLAALVPAALRAGAVGENAQAVLDQLAYLQGVDISPEWVPDIQANQGAVQQLLDLYLACPEAERAEFSADEINELKAYFTALYQVQGKDVAEVEALFEAGGPPASSDSLPPPVVPGSIPSISSVPQAVASQPGEVVQPDSVSEASSMPQVQNPPQVPGNQGWLGLFGNSTLGIVLLVVLALVVVVLFVRFLAALRAAGRVQKQERLEDFQQRELFGENYTSEDIVLPDEEEAAEKPQTKPAAQTTEKPAQREARPAATPHEASTREKPAVKESAAKPEEKPAAQAAPEAQPPERIGFNPEPANSITMRSFSAQPRTGKPAKQSFRQGSPDDLDAIDD